ncbi:sulfotransferase family 2 domain-containing protein [Vibrio sp. 1CM23M]|uniref:sulfotransferase family 2 domain-containing protein n=1 Tax=Vibrio sp. 1CM23M TaxID=2929164 RepID=UPI00249E356F|nr:sulfotransferase family 2 domain-containing protein [Vibrio sp. 1CM23M]
MSIFSEHVLSRLRYSSFVLESEQAIYIECTKCACSSVKTALLEYLGIDISCTYTQGESSFPMSVHERSNYDIPSIASYDVHQVTKLVTDYYIFSIVRNPYARIISSWSDKIRQEEPNYIGICKEIRKFNNLGSDDDIDFKSFVEWLTLTQDPLNCEPHWQLQTELISYKTVPIDKLIYLESFSTDIDDLQLSQSLKDIINKTKVNESLPLEKHWSNYYTSEIADKVYDFYQDDFIAFGYSKLSWLTDKEKRIFELDIDVAISSIRARNQVISYLNDKLLASPKKNILIVTSDSLDCVESKISFNWVNVDYLNANDIDGFGGFSTKYDKVFYLTSKNSYQDVINFKKISKLFGSLISYLILENKHSIRNMIIKHILSRENVEFEFHSNYEKLVRKIVWNN